MINILVALYAFFLNLLAVSIGMAFIYSVARVLNLAHGAFFVLGGYLATALITSLGPVPGALATAAILAALPPLLYLYVRFARDELEQLFVTYALLLLMEGLFKLVFGYGNYTLADLAAGLGAVFIEGQRIPNAYLLGGAAVAGLMAVLYILLYKTRLGLYMRAVSDDSEMAAALGVKSPLVQHLSIFLGVFTTSLLGAVAATWQAYTLGLSAEVLIYAFAALVIGGLGNLWGVAAASALVAAVRTATVMVYPELELLAIYLVVIAVLLVRPGGIFTRHARVA
ncbi:amino acid/amide ABC transporter membrane protein 1, HAAT family [Pyrobaculum sp. WP30]|nr:amino acid/amide ABC transporter membrane protein 1, HAAT family [Pyrobaculum sp. WP30]